MARSRKIRLTENDRKVYNQLAKNSKAKISRTLKNYGVNLSDEISIPSLESFQTRDEFNEWKEKASSFTNRNNLKYQFVKNEHGVVASKSFLNEITRNRAKEIRLAKQELKKIKEDPAAKQELLKMADPSRMGIHIPKPFNFREVRSRDRLEDVARNAKRRSEPKFYDKRSTKMHETFIRELEEAFNSDADWLVDKIRNMDIGEFINMYRKYSSFDFQIFYLLKYADEFQANKYLLEMERDYQRYQTDERAKDLKDF